ncbi:MAG: ECF transporter S component [Clostridia bacterium]|nr:ECF transporter S component [Clostridia bacterium]
MSRSKTVEIRSIVYAAVCLAMCMVLPLLTGNIPEIGQQFAPMHFPVFLCGFIAGPFWGAVVGFVAPFLRYFIFSVPVIYPQGVRMAAELLVYGMAAGLFYRYLPKKPIGIYVSLLCAQFFGRLAWGAAQYLISVFDKSNEFYLEMVVAQTITSSLYGILIQLLLIPPIVFAMQKARFISKY